MKTTPMISRGRRPALTGAALLLLCAAAHAQERSAPDLVELNLTELMKVEVTTASKKAQKLSDVPAAVYVISGDDIRRSGARSLAEALRLAPGVDVGAIGANRYAVSIRGFNGRFANKLLVLIDGRSVYTPLWSGVLWESQDTVLDDIDRIEVIRGPGAAIWGANAVNGVINIITKPAGETGGLLLLGEAGSGGLRGATLRYGTEGAGVPLRVYAKVERRGEFTDVTGRGAADDSRAARVGFRLDRDAGPSRLTLQGEVFRLGAGDRITAGTVTAPYWAEQVEREDDRGYHLLGRWSGPLGPLAASLQAYYDYSEIRVPILTYARRRTADLDFNFHYARSAHDLIFGLGYRNSRDHTRDEQLIRFDPRSRSLSIASAFVQDEITLAPERWKLTAGAKFEHHTYTGLHISPNVRLLWNMTPADTAWLAVSRAVRTPSRGERDALFAWDVLPPDPGLPGLAGRLPTRTVITATHNLDAERLTACEFGYRGQFAARLALDVSVFHHRYQGLIKRAPDFAAASVVGAPAPYVSLPIVLSNRLTLPTYGAEVALDWRPLDWWRVTGGYSRIHIGVDRDADLENMEGSTPRYLASLRSAFDFERFQVDVWARKVAQRPMYATPAQRVPAYSNVDLRVAWKAAPGVEVALGVQDLFDRRYQQFYVDKVTSAPLRARRTATVQIKLAY